MESLKWIPCIRESDRVIQAISKHVIAEETLTNRCKCVGIEESTDVGVVITGLQVIEAGILGADNAIERLAGQLMAGSQVLVIKLRGQ